MKKKKKNSLFKPVNKAGWDLVQNVEFSQEKKKNLIQISPDQSQWSCLPVVMVRLQLGLH